MSKNLCCIAIVSSILIAGCGSLDTPVRISLLGDAAPDSAAQRTIVIGPGTRDVNVTGGEIVRFDVNAKTFTWHFDGAMNLTRFSLQQIAPAGLLDHPVRAYVRPDPFFIGGDMN